MEILFLVGILIFGLWVTSGGATTWVAKLRRPRHRRPTDTADIDGAGFHEGERTTTAQGDACQRLRECRADEEHLTLAKWSEEHASLGSHSRSSRGSQLDHWKREQYQSSLARYPTLPEPQSQTATYAPVSKLVLTDRDYPHTDDLRVFRDSLGWSLWAYLNPEYPVAKPIHVFPAEPSPPSVQVVDGRSSDVDGAHAWAKELLRDRIAYWEQKRKVYNAALAARTKVWEVDKASWEVDAAKDARRFGELRKAYRKQAANDVARYMQVMLDHEIPLPTWCPSGTEAVYSAEGRVLLLNVALPDTASLEVMKTRSLKSGAKRVLATASESREFRKWLFHFLPIRFLWGAWKLDSERLVDLFCVNGVVEHIDGATGQQRTDTVSSVIAKPEQLASLVMEAIDPVECFKSLKGMASADTSSIVPVAPLIRLDREDGRFVDGRDVIEGAAETNLAAMDWEDFEHLVRELLEKEFGDGGAEVKITQASRDKGVDAVIFDPDPLRGGKIVVQAKRYTNVVDVSAVRDLYGTIMNEGAMKGILVTTSNYGGDSYDFAKDKPITLMNGSNLLHLLEKHGYHAKIDLAEAKRLLT